MAHFIRFTKFYSQLPLVREEIFESVILNSDRIVCIRESGIEENEKTVTVTLDDRTEIRFFKTPLNKALELLGLNDVPVRQLDYLPHIEIQSPSGLTFDNTPLRLDK